MADFGDRVKAASISIPIAGFASLMLIYALGMLEELLTVRGWAFIHSDIRVLWGVLFVICYGMSVWYLMRSPKDKRG